MRNRNLILLLAVLLSAALIAGCGSKRQLTKQENDRLQALQAGLADAEKIPDAKACAPKEMANLRAEIDGVRHEASESWEDGFKPSSTSASNIPEGEKKLAALKAKLKECEEKKLVPMCGLVAEPDTVAPGKCATLKWKGENVNKIVWGADETDKKAEVAPLTGSKEVCPKETMDYQMACVGKWAVNYEAATVTVAVPPPPAPAPVVVPAPAPKAPQKVDLRVNFDTAKADIRPADLAELQKGVQFLKANPGAKIAITGYTDSRGSDKYNQKLSEARANSVKKYLEGEVAVKPENITAVGKGEADPIGDNKTKKGQFENRRVEIKLAD
jgi:outer membrane protein OmpA-like peptidoglycan-associated protein/outer membrane murein-binding lipoprotein Lpp